jgi:hypothetical protein
MVSSSFKVRIAHIEHFKPQARQYDESEGRDISTVKAGRLCDRYLVEGTRASQSGHITPFGDGFE